MKQQINLYLPEFRRKKDPLTFDNMILAVSLLVIVIIAMTAKESWDSHGINNELAVTQQNLDALRAENEQLVQEYGSQSQDPALLSRVESLEEEIRNKRTLQRFLDGRNIGSTRGFSEYLADLSRYHLGGLRLTSIDLLDGGNRVLLEGEVLSAYLVPQYFQSLRQGNSFTGKEFESLKIMDVTAEDGSSVNYKHFSAATAN